MRISVLFCWLLPGVALAAESVFRVGSGETYASPQAAYDAMPSTLSASTDYVVEIEDSATYGVPGGNTYPIEIDRSLVWGSGARIVFRAAIHHAEGSGGPLIQASTAYLIRHTATAASGTPAYVFRGMRMKSTGGNGATYAASFANHTYSVRFTECHLSAKDTTSGSYDFIRYDDPDMHGTITVDNCTISQDSGTTTRSAFRASMGFLQTGSGMTVNWYNNTMAGEKTGIIITDGSGDYLNGVFNSRNNVWLATTTVFSNDSLSWTVSRDYEAHTGTGTSGANSDNSITAATFYNTATWARIAAATPNAIDDDGETLASTYEVDVSGVTRGGVTAWSKGSREYSNNHAPAIALVSVEKNSGSGYLSVSAPYAALDTDLVRVTASASDPDQGDISSTISWSIVPQAGGDPVFTGTGASVVYNPVLYDDYDVFFAVTDAGGASDSDSIALEIGRDLIGARAHRKWGMWHRLYWRGR